jgi:hypothetical protein
MSRSQVINRLEGLQAVGSGDIGLCFAYFTCGDASFRDLDSLILALFEQLCRKQDAVPSWMLQAKSESRHPSKLASIDNLVKLTSCHRQTYIVLDGLDECPKRDRRSILDFIHFLRQAKQVFKVFLTSRNEDDIASYFDCNEVVQLYTSSQGNLFDIESYILTETSKRRHSPNGRQLTVQSETLFNDIVSTLIRKADGM